MPSSPTARDAAEGRRLARNLTEAQRRALEWICSAPDDGLRPWHFSVDARTHDALARMGLIVSRDGSISATEAGHRALHARTTDGGEA